MTSSTADVVERLWRHLKWADERVFNVLCDGAPSGAWREYSHILAAEEVWLARMEGRPPTVAVWPELDADQAVQLRESVVGGYTALISALDEDALRREISYSTTSGARHATAIVDILLHVAMHGQYHRGKINRALRDAETAPVTLDYIVFAREHACDA